MNGYEAQTASRICGKWVKKLGFGFHPDTRGKDYDPPLSKAEIKDYERDMNWLFTLNLDPYAFGVEAIEAMDK